MGREIARDEREGGDGMECMRDRQLDMYTQRRSANKPLRVELKS